MSASSPRQNGARTLAIATVTAALLLPAPAFALSGLYSQFGFGYGRYGGSELILNELPGSDAPQTGAGCCASGGVAFQLRLGYSFFGVAGEFGFIGNAFDLSKGTGGGGTIGGGLRIFPLDFIALLGIDVTDIPIDFGAGVLFGYALVGKDFAYEGVGLEFDVHADYELTDLLSVGVKLDIGVPSFGDFVYTDFNNDRGRCLDDRGEHLVGTGGNKDDVSCNGSGPSTTFISPQLVVTLHVDFLE